MKGTAKRLAVALAAAGAATTMFMATAGNAAASSCVFDAGAKSMTVAMDPGGVTTLSVSGADLTVDGAACLGATTTNTDSISVAGHAGSNERLVIDQRGGLFSPGATPESNVPEIEMTANLGDAGDTVVVYGTEGDDAMSSGENGVALFSDGDVDIVITPHAVNLEVHLLGGNDFFNGRGTYGAGLAYKGPILATGGDGNDYIRTSVKDDVIDSGAGNDDLEGNFGHDVINAGPGDDLVNGGSDNDTIDLGPGADSVIAGSGNDVVIADDGEADASLVGGANVDTLKYDCGGLDPAPSQFETLTCGGTPPPPPPPPSGPCQYDPVTKKVTATIPASENLGILTIVSNEIMFAAPSLQSCGATTATAEEIVVVGKVGVAELLLISQLEGGYIGGTPEATGVSEIEITVSLGDASDRVSLEGSPANDAISVGLKGIATNADGDLDIAITPMSSEIWISGKGGTNSLSGRGGAGTGGVFLGTLLATAGSLGDTILGGAGPDRLFGGDGNDVIEGREGNDELSGDAGNDTLSGQGGNDQITGGGGADVMSGSDGDDVFLANDGVADTSINGGPGVDTATYDAALDTAIVAVENRNGV